jgi:pimeloyl-ACP methyl ester carboxylesterase
MTRRTVVFSHGKDSSPRSRKIESLRETCRAERCEMIAVDYRGIDSPRDRIHALVDACKYVTGDLVLVGSSLGGYVSLAAATTLHARGIFLMAPALYFEELPPLHPTVFECPFEVVHGWNDEVVPIEHSLRLSREFGATLHIVNSDHSLHSHLRMIRFFFEHFLITLDLPPDLR